MKNHLAANHVLSGLVVLYSLSFGSACSLIVDGPEEVDLQNNAVEVNVTAVGRVDGEPQTIVRRFRVCMPDALNPNKTGGATPTFEQLDNYCRETLVPIAQGMLEQCTSQQLRSFEYECAVNPVTFVDAACEETCRAEAVDQECSNLDTATAVLGVPEFACLAERSMDGEGLQAMGSALQQRSTCEVTGAFGSTITIARGDDRQSQPAAGVVEFSGDPFPGSQVGLASRVSDVGSFTFDGLGGLVDATLKNVVGSSSSRTRATLSASGSATFMPATVLATGAGKLEKPLSPDESRIYVTANINPVLAGIGLDARMCSVDSVMTGQESGGDAVEITTRLRGRLMNLPPRAYAGPDEVVECTSPAGATVSLNCTQSTDLDGNIVAYQWRSGTRTGDELGTLQSTVSTNQGLNTTHTYACNVLDAFGQMSSDSKSVTVRDTTAPTVMCNAPATITPVDAPITFTATATDTCDPAAGATVVIEGYDCFMLQNGKRVNKTESCQVALNGATITIRDSGGVGDNIVWIVRAADASGNTRRQMCQVAVKRTKL